MSCDLRARLLVWPIELERLGIRGEPSADFGPIHLFEEAFSTGGDINHPIMDEINLRIDIARRQPCEITDLGDWCPVGDHPQNSIVRAAALLAAYA